MDFLLYPASLVIIVLLAFVLHRTNHNLLMVIVLAIGVYIIYSHETGHTATAFKNEVIESIDKSAGKFSKEHDSEVYDVDKAEEVVK